MSGEKNNGTPWKKNVEYITETANEVMTTKSFYHIEIQHVLNELKDFSCIVLGPPRVGKSTLINSITQKEVAPVCGGFESCTKTINDYIIDVDVDRNHRLHFFDLPGIESWKEEDIYNCLEELFNRTKPIVAFVIVSPSCFANINEFKNVIKKLAIRNIALCFVLTNKYAGSKQQIDESWKQLHTLASSVAKGIRIDVIPDELIKWENALMIKINAGPFIAVTPNRNKTYPSHNLDKLLLYTFSLLTTDKIAGWCLALLNNRTFWEKADHSVHGFTYEYLPNLLRSLFHKEVCDAKLSSEDRPATIKVLDDMTNTKQQVILASNFMPLVISKNYPAANNEDVDVRGSSLDANDNIALELQCPPSSACDSNQINSHNTNEVEMIEPAGHTVTISGSMD